MKSKPKRAIYHQIEKILTLLSKNIDTRDENVKTLLYQLEFQSDNFSDKINTLIIDLNTMIINLSDPYFDDLSYILKIYFRIENIRKYIVSVLDLLDDDSDLDSGIIDIIETLSALLIEEVTLEVDINNYLKLISTNIKFIRNYVEEALSSGTSFRNTDLLESLYALEDLIRVNLLIYEKGYPKIKYDSMYGLAEAIKPYDTYTSVMAEKTVNNFELIPDLLSLMQALNLDSKSLFYPSNRPKTDMRDIHTIKERKKIDKEKIYPSSHVLVGEQYLNITEVIEGQVDIPVARYGSAISGLYRKEVLTSKSFCGKFYYYEPDSQIYLRSYRTLITPNKLTAMVHLFGIDTTVRYIAASITVDGLVSLKSNQLSSNQLYRPLALPSEYFGCYISNNWKEVLEMMTNGTFDFLKFYPGFYAKEDKFDQIICKKSEYDTIVFTSMTGKTRIVSEVLDIRGNYDNLFRV